MILLCSERRGEGETERVSKETEQWKKRIMCSPLASNEFRSLVDFSFASFLSRPETMSSSKKN
jgi:hypothetical protein